MTTLRAQGYAFSRDYAGADLVIVNTCGFLDSAKQESLEAIGEEGDLDEATQVLVTVERAPGPAAPTSDPVLATNLS